MSVFFHQYSWEWPAVYITLLRELWLDAGKSLTSAWLQYQINKNENLPLYSTTRMVNPGDNFYPANTSPRWYMKGKKLAFLSCSKLLDAIGEWLFVKKLTLLNIYLRFFRNSFIVSTAAYNWGVKRKLNKERVCSYISLTCLRNEIFLLSFKPSFCHLVLRSWLKQTC